MRNKGFTLVEVIVSLAIMAIVAGAVGTFVVAGNNSYMRGSRELTIQEEAQLTANQLIDMIIDVEKGITFEADTAEAVDTEGNPAHTADGGIAVAPVKELKLYNKDTVYMVRWQGAGSEPYSTANQLYLYEAENTEEDDGTLSVGNVEAADANLMAQYVTDFQVDLSHLADRKVILNMTFSNNGLDYQISETIKLRNCAVDSPNMSEIYPDGSGEYNWITSLKIVPEHVELNRGSSFAFSYEMEGDPEAVARGVTWKVAYTADGTVPGDGTGTHINGDGKIMVGSSEALGENVLTVTCVSVADASKTATATVTVKESTVQSLTITPKEATVMQGDSIEFQCETVPAGAVVRWSLEAMPIEGNEIAEGTTIGLNGKLTVGEKQQTGAHVLQVVCRSADDLGIYDTANVTVVPKSNIDGKYDARLIATNLTTYQFVGEDGREKTGYKAEIECLPNYADYLNGYPKIKWQETTAPEAYKIQGNEPDTESQFTATLYCGTQKDTTAYVQAIVQLSADVTVIIGIDISIPDLMTTVDASKPYIDSEQFVLNRNGDIHCVLKNYENTENIRWCFQDTLGIGSYIGFDLEAGAFDNELLYTVKSDAEGWFRQSGSESGFDVWTNTPNLEPEHIGPDATVRAKWYLDWNKEYRLTVQAWDGDVLVAESIVLIPRFDILFSGGEHVMNINRNTWWNPYDLEVYGFKIGQSSTGQGNFQRLVLEAKLESEEPLDAGTQIVYIGSQGERDSVAMNLSGSESNDFIMLRVRDMRMPEAERLLMFQVCD